MTKLERQLRRKMGETMRQWALNQHRHYSKAQLDPGLCYWIAVRLSVRHLHDCGVTMRQCRRAYRPRVKEPPCSDPPF